MIPTIYNFYKPKINLTRCSTTDYIYAHSNRHDFTSIEITCMYIPLAYTFMVAIHVFVGIPAFIQL